MQRLKNSRDDRGAVAVWVAILLIPLMVCAALAIDVGAANADRQRLQHGADAAALAIAHDCAAGACGDYNGTADEIADANAPFGEDNPSGALTENADLDAGYVEVATTSNRDHWFAPVIGLDEIALSGLGAAIWAPPGGGRSAIPFTFAACELAELGVLELGADGQVVGLDPDSIGQRIRLEQSKVTDPIACDQPTSGMYAPGGFGWLASDEPDCSVFTRIGVPVDSGSGNAQGSESAACYTALKSAIDAPGEEVALLPVFSSQEETGDKQYTIIGYVAVTLEGYRFQGSRHHGEDEDGDPASANDNKPEQGNGGWIVVTPREFIASEADFEADPDAPDLGTVVVSLVLPREP